MQLLFSYDLNQNEKRFSIVESNIYCFMNTTVESKNRYM